MALFSRRDVFKVSNSSTFYLSNCMTCIKEPKYTRFCSSAFICLFIFIFILSFHSAFSFNLNDKNTKSLNSCEKCKIVVQSFIEGLKRTSRGKHEGGDADWEENKLLNYANSEIRLIEIQEHLCLEVPSGKDQCHSFAEEYESELEEWFFKLPQKENPDQIEGSTLFEHLCNGISKACCPEGHFGPNCAPCSGYPGEVCYGRGICAGNGTREGSGGCICFKGFKGQNCEKCAKNYFASGTIDKLVGQQVVQIPDRCERCDRSCDSTCHSSGPKGCSACRKGFMWDNEYGCVDVNECSQLETNPCKESTYCFNTEGSSKCLQCHKACKGCIGSGEESCIECADGFELANGKCIAKTDHWFSTWSPYTIYFGLAVITLILTRVITFNGSFSLQVRV